VRWNGGRYLSLSRDLVEAIDRRIAVQLRAYLLPPEQAIGDLGYNLAVAQLRTGDVREALRTARETRAELARRRVEPPAELLLAQAAALYRAGDKSSALSTVGEILDRSTREAETAARAWYIRGLILAERGDVAGVREAASALPAAGVQPDIEAGRQELQGRVALMEGRPQDALAAFEATISRRQDALAIAACRGRLRWRAMRRWCWDAAPTPPSSTSAPAVA
jgi:hypothetical protein